MTRSDRESDATRQLSVGEALIASFESRDVRVVFGIPGVHTIELYRGLSASSIQHVTPRHEQGAAFMADGYARVSGKPGVCLLISGPGLTNAITGMAQARADRIPMLVISAVNARDTLGRNRGYLHELPDQSATMASIALATRTLTDPAALESTLDELYSIMLGGRPGPVHLQVPLDVMMLTASPASSAKPDRADVREPFPVSVGLRKPPGQDDVSRAVSLCRQSEHMVLLVGGGLRRKHDALRKCADCLDAPVVSTINARGCMAGHVLDVPASPGLQAVRAMIAEADLVIAVGTEMGPTDYDMYDRGAMPPPRCWIQVDSDDAQLIATPTADLAIECDGGAFLEAFADALAAGESDQSTSWGVARAQQARSTARAQLSETYRSHTNLIQTLWAALPDATIVGDSTQLIYAGNLFVDAPRPRAWFNSATGYGTLGYAPGAAIGAWLADKERPVISLVGDGGLQFSLAELGTARDLDADVVFVVWNNEGFREIDISMRDAGVSPIGVTPSAPDFIAVAAAYGLPALRVHDSNGLDAALRELPRPCLIEWKDGAT